MTRNLSLVLLAATCAWADQITLSNGDRLTGSIVRSDTKELVLKTEFAGTVTIAWSAITAITADTPVFVSLSGGQTVSGPVQAANGQVQVRTESAGVVTAQQSAVEGIRSAGEQAAFVAQLDRLRNPRLVDLWTGTLDLGLAATQGNAETQTFSLASRAERATNRDKIVVFYTSIFASNSTTGVKETTANSKRGGLTYDVNLNRRLFAWGSAELESDQFQELDLRFVPAGGAGYHAINSDITKLDFRFGASGNREFFATGLSRNSAEVIVGEDLSHKFAANTTLTQRLRFFPNVSNTGQFRFNFDTTLATAFPPLVLAAIYGERPLPQQPRAGPQEERRPVQHRRPALVCSLITSWLLPRAAPPACD